MPRMMGLPLKISGFSVMRLRSVSSIMIALLQKFDFGVGHSQYHLQ